MFIILAAIDSLDYPPSAIAAAVTLRLTKHSVDDQDLAQLGCMHNRINKVWIYLHNSLLKNWRVQVVFVYNKCRRWWRRFMRTFREDRLDWSHWWCHQVPLVCWMLLCMEPANYTRLAAIIWIQVLKDLMFDFTDKGLKPKKQVLVCTWNVILFTDCLNDCFFSFWLGWIDFELCGFFLQSLDSHLSIISSFVISLSSSWSE